MYSTTTNRKIASLTPVLVDPKTHYDGLGLTFESRQYEDATNYIAAKTEFDALGRPYRTSNPYRSGYSSTQGRFTSPDPLLSSGIPSDPRSWNRYSYCLNHPFKYTDPTGLIWQTRTTVNRNVSTTEYLWVWQDEPQSGWDKVTNFHPDIMGSDGKMIGLHLNPNGPKSIWQKLLELGPGFQMLNYQDDYHVKGYEFTANKADRAFYSRTGAVDTMPNQAFDVGLTLAGIRGLGLARVII